MRNVPDAPWIGDDEWDRVDEYEDPDEDFKYESQRDEELLEELFKGE